MKKIVNVVLLSLVVVLLAGCESEPTYRQYCDRCKSGILDECAITAFEPYTFCTFCANNHIRDIRNGEITVCRKCGREYYYGNQYGICEDCEGEYLVRCTACESYTISWGDETEIVFCPDCMAKAVQYEPVKEALYEWEFG